MSDSNSMWEDNLSPEQIESWKRLKEFAKDSLNVHLFNSRAIAAEQRKKRIQAYSNGLRTAAATRRADEALVRELRYTSHRFLDYMDDVKLTFPQLCETLERRSFNHILAGYYHELGEDQKASAVKGCLSTWDTDFYELARVRDLKRTYRCKDHFCVNCQRQQGQQRHRKYGPLLNEIAESHDWYHLVLTVPNVPGAELSRTIDKLLNGFKYFIRLFSGNIKPKWHDFSQYGYFGAIRNFEVTFEGDMYHPHIHCFIALRQGLDLPGKHLNCFSYSKNRDPYAFSDLEILLQKLWYLIENGGNGKHSVTKVNIERLETGYSVFCSKITDGAYGEVFKYMVKPHSDFMSFEQFKTMYKAFHRRRLMQGYGALYGIKEHIDEQDQQTYLVYCQVRAALLAVCAPKHELCSLERIVDESDQGVRIISREKCDIAIDDVQSSK